MKKISVGILVSALAILATAATAMAGSTASTTSGNVMNSVRDLAATPAARDVVVRVDEVLNAITWTHWSMSDETWDDDAGIFETDCSGYVNRLVEDVSPGPYDALLAARDTTRPDVGDYHAFLRGIAFGATRDGWYRVKRVSDLRPGDLVLWKYDVAPASGATGHMGIVVSRPVLDARWPNVYRVRVSDSARSGHSNDNRGSAGGVGAGEILLKVDSLSGVAYQVAWSTKGYFRDDVSFALGRLAGS